MSNFDQLTVLTASERHHLQANPVIARALGGDVTRELYLAFLEQAYHHVKHTVPLLMAVGSRLTPRHHWLQKEIVHYLVEEEGHEAWILSDIDAVGGDAPRVRDGMPSVETDAMVAYAWDTAMRRNPVAFFGMVFVLEGTSVALALNAASSIQRALQLPGRAFTYLLSHGSLDQEHVGHLASVVNRLDATEDLPAVVTCARAMYRLYDGVFISLERAANEPDDSQLKGAA
jgi:pyrroloquinoline quinone (PQQ) biosynthesis protein C